MWLKKHLYGFSYSLSSSIVAGIFYDILKSSVITSGFETLLPALAFLVKPVMTVLGVSLGATVVTFGIRDILTWHKNRKEKRKQEAIAKELEKNKRKTQEKDRAERKAAEKRKQIREYILKRFNWLLDWHDSANTNVGTHRKPSKVVSDTAQAMVYTEDLQRLGLVRPDLIGVARYRKKGLSDGVRYLSMLKEIFVHRGYEAAKRTAEEWKVPDRTPSRIATSND